ncbi:MAG: RloB domain-containing protein [Lachnospiraceae bacterium]|nr:RloB domain-containing protein [Lachnospiraceae bacterium]
MAVVPKSRISNTILNPFRTRRPTTDKIIFLSCEGSVTEEEYFQYVSEMFNELKSKVQFVSVVEDEIHTIRKYRTDEQNKKLSKGKPKQLIEKIEQFKLEKDEIFQFESHKDDEFWIVMDIDQNLSENIKDSCGKSFKDYFIETLDKCDEKGYKYAISNPFFEMWLLLHHDVQTEEDKKYAVTQEHEYEATGHYRQRMRELRVPMRGNANKDIKKEDYTKEKVMEAVKRAELLHTDKTCRYPEYFATTVYQLMNKITDLLPKAEVE